MNARNRAAKAWFLTCALLLLLAASPSALALSFPGSDTVVPPPSAKPIPLAVIGDDPDPVPLGIVDPGDSRVVVLEPSRSRVSAPRLWLAACFVSGLPAWTGNPQITIGLELLSSSFRRAAPVDRRIRRAPF